MAGYTLCWDCKNAATSGCRWSKDLKPVEGWTAVKTDKRLSKGLRMSSFLVIECPEFERDAYNGGLMRKEEYEARMKGLTKDGRDHKKERAAGVPGI